MQCTLKHKEPGAEKEDHFSRKKVQMPKDINRESPYPKQQNIYTFQRDSSPLVSFPPLNLPFHQNQGNLYYH